MEKEELNIKWKECLTIFEDNVGKEHFDTLFKYTDIYRFDEGKLVLSVKSAFIKSQLETHFLDLMQKTFQRVFKQNVKLYYKVLVVEEPTVDNTEYGKTNPPTKPEEAKPTVGLQPHSSQTQQINSFLHDSYTFDNYIEGNSNRLARSVGESIAHKPATTFNPLFVYGPSGCGKTHLVTAIGHLAKQLHPEMRVLYVSAHLFMVQWTNACKNNVRNDFIAFYQTIDMLIIDDVQELSGKTDTQNTFFHIFNHLQMNKKQIILTADRTPVAIQGLEDRLLTRFKWGMLAEVERPDSAMRLNILKSKVANDGIEISDNVLKYIADNITDSIRDLEGIITSLLAHTVSMNVETVTIDMVKKILPRYIEKVEIDKPITLEHISSTVCEYFNVSEQDILSRSRKQPIAYIRQMLCFLASKHTDISDVQLGMRIGGRNHATVIHSIRQIQNLLETDPITRQNFEDLEQRIHL